MCGEPSNPLKTLVDLRGVRRQSLSVPMPKSPECIAGNINCWICTLSETTKSLVSGEMLDLTANKPPLMDVISPSLMSFPRGPFMVAATASSSSPMTAVSPRIGDSSGVDSKSGTPSLKDSESELSAELQTQNSRALWAVSILKRQ